MPRVSRLTKPLPWYAWNPVQWQASRKVQRMTWAERGLYRELMDECWLKGSVPATAEGIADLFGCDLADVEPLLAAVKRCFIVEGEVMKSIHIEDLRTETDSFRVAQSERRKTQRDEPPSTTTNQLTGPSTSEPVPVPASCEKDQLVPAWTSSTVQYSTEQYPPTPLPVAKVRAKRKVRDLTGDLGLLEEVFQAHPARPGRAKGSRAKTLPRLLDVQTVYGLTPEDCRAVIAKYRQYPNVQEGFVQLTETFWGSSGHWLDCWTAVRRDREVAAQLSGTGPSGGGNGVEGGSVAPRVGSMALNGENKSQEVGS